MTLLSTIILVGAGCSTSGEVNTNVETTKQNQKIEKETNSESNSGAMIGVESTSELYMDDTIQSRTDAEVRLKSQLAALKENYSSLKAEYSAAAEKGKTEFKDNWLKVKVALSEKIDAAEDAYDNMVKANAEAWVEAKTNANLHIDKAQDLYVNVKQDLNADLNLK